MTEPLAAAPTTHPMPAPSSATGGRLVWIDVVKGMAILAVLFHHYVEPGVKFRVLLSDAGASHSLRAMWTVALGATHNAFNAALMCLGGLGYQGVHVFLVVSGLGLALADARRAAPMPFAAFLRRRASRLLPPYWLVVALLGVLGLVMSRAHWQSDWLIGSSKSDLLINVFLVRDFSEKWVWIYPGALWFVPLIVQLYLVYPLLARGLQKRPAMTLMLCLALTLGYRALAVLLWHGRPVGIEAAGRVTPMMFGAARLWEFALGVALAAWFAGPRASNGIGMSRLLLKPALAISCGAALWLLGCVATCYRPGFIVGEPLIATGLFALCSGLARTLFDWRPLRAAFLFLGRHSYALFLTHSLLIPTPLIWAPGHSFLGGFVVFCLAACALALALEAILKLLEAAWQAAFARRAPQPA